MRPVPELTQEQRKAAIEKGIENRRERADALKRLKNGELSLEDIFKSESEAIKRIMVIKLLLAFDGVGNVRANKIMEEIKIAKNRRVLGLGYRQKIALLEWEKSRQING